MAEHIGILSEPYDSGHHLARMGRGPVDLLDRGLADAIRAMGHTVEVAAIDHGLPFPMENAVAFELHGRIGDAVRQSRAADAFPLLLSGNCNYASIGAVTGLAVDDTGVLWFDAHGESETPETSTSAFLDGMGLAMLVGGCWAHRLADVPGFRALDPRRAVLVGARDFSADEADFMDERGIGRVSVEAVRDHGAAALAPDLERLRDLGVRRLYVHVDADVYDPDMVGHANAYSASAGTGLTAPELGDCLEDIARRIPIQAAAITAYDPEVDPDGRMRGPLIELAAQFAHLGTI